MSSNPFVDIAQQSTTVAPQQQQSQERTPDAPQIGTAEEPQNNSGISPADQDTLIALVKSYKAQWSQDRLFLIQKCLTNLEFFKGNQFISFGPGNTTFDANNWIGSVGNGNHAENADDKDLYQYCNNFYQMLATGFVAALSPQVPNSKWLPE